MCVFILYQMPFSPQNHVIGVLSRLFRYMFVCMLVCMFVRHKISCKSEISREQIKNIFFKCRKVLRIISFKCDNKILKTSKNIPNKHFKIWKSEGNLRIREQIQDLRSQIWKLISKCQKSVNKISKMFKQKCHNFHLRSSEGHLRVVWGHLRVIWKSVTTKNVFLDIFIICGPISKLFDIWILYINC